jgi:hypothetical protein
MRTKLGIVIAAAGTVAAATATGAFASPGTAVHPAAAHSTPAPLVGYSAPSQTGVTTLTVADNGKTIHVPRGRHILVRLAVNPKQNQDATTWWHGITESGDALKAQSPGIVARPGVTEARYEAIARGEATLSSSRAVCPQHPGAPSCHSMQGWQVTIDVR